MKEPRIRPPKMYSGLQRQKTIHQLYLKMSYLELEKTRRQKEQEALTRRIQTLERRMLQIEEEIGRTQAEIKEHPDRAPVEKLDAEQKNVHSTAEQLGRTTWSRSPVSPERDEPMPPTAPGLVIKY